MNQPDSSHIIVPRLGQRKRPLPQPCANPLFLRWMSLLLDEAQAKKRQTRWNFAKALKALRRYPLVMKEPGECILLEGFGKGTCEVLTKKLHEFASERGFIVLEEALRIGNSEAAEEMLMKRQQCHKLMPKDNFTETSSSVFTCSNNKTQSVAPKASSHYIPRFRSASYALLMGLLEHHSTVEANKLNKTALIAKAQPFADASLLLPDSPGSFYSGWSSMSTLIQRGLVVREVLGKNGAHFYLTEAGLKLAEDLKKATSNDEHDTFRNSQHSDNSTAKLCNDNKEKNGVDSDDEMPCPLLQRLNSTTFSSISNCTTFATLPTVASVVLKKPTLSFWYINEKGEKVGRKNDAQVSIPEGPKTSDFIGFLVECTYESLLTSGFDYRLDYNSFGTLADGLVRAFLSDADTPDFCSAFENDKIEQNYVVSVGKLCFAGKNNASVSLPECSRSVLDKINSKASTSVPIESDFQHPEPKKLYNMQPGSFEVVLCLDNREHFGMGCVRQQLLPSLLRNGVKCDVRPLNIGDFLWVARQITENDDGKTKSCREVVLDCIVERKRIDDLASSIKDGRFREQKWRLNRCGLSQTVLLIEDMGGDSSSRWLGLPVETLEQSIVNAAVHDGCIIKRCRTARDTVTYLSMLTAMLLESYKKLEIVAFDRASTRVISSSVKEKAVHLIDFAHFQRASAKSQKLSAREHAAKQLLQIRGCTASRAAAILAHYPTVQSLYRASIAPNSSPLFLSELTYDSERSKKIGAALSRAIFATYATLKDPFAAVSDKYDDGEEAEFLEPLDEFY